MSSANSICTALLRMDTPINSSTLSQKKTERGHSIYLALSS